MAEIEKLLEGYKVFYEKNFVLNDGDAFKDIQTSQSPKTLIIACCDSRVDPVILTNAKIGDIFVIRNIANLVPPYQPMWDSNHGTSAAIEFAVNHLKVKHIVVMGHSNCGGIKALIDDDIDINKEFSFITDWIRIAKKIKEDIPKDLTNEEKYIFCEQAGIKVSLKNLMTFPFVKEKTQNKTLKLHGWYFSLKDGSLSTLNKEADKFEKTDISL